MRPTRELQPFAAGLRAVLDANTAFVRASDDRKMLGALAPDAEANVTSEDIAAAEVTERDADIALDAAILSYTDQLLDLYEARWTSRQAKIIEENLELRPA